MNDPVVQGIVGGAALVIVVAIVIRMINRRLERAAAARRRRELQATRGELARRQEEIERLASRIIATSSTKTIAGFAVERQIEAVFTEGHPSPARAVEVLKALAAEKGANAIVNLDSQRPPSGRCAASGDAVIVRALPTRRPAAGEPAAPGTSSPSGSAAQAAPPPPPPPPRPRP